MGPTAEVLDQGGSMLSALASIYRVEDNEALLSEDNIATLMAQVKDPMGTFYCYTLPKSIIKRKVREKKQVKKEV
jgi:F420-non-reducing hydrogenase small subunit